MGEIYSRIMVDLIEKKTKYIDEKWKALQNNDEEKVKECDIKIETINETMKMLRDLYIKID